MGAEARRDRRSASRAADFAVGESKLTIQLVAPGDRVVADASTMLSLIRDWDIAEADVTAIPDAAEPQSPDTKAEATEAAAQDVTASIDAAPASADAASAASEVVPLPTRRPEPPKSDAADANWIRPTAYVNLRDAPSPSGAVLGVVAKGAKLRVAAGSAAGSRSKTRQRRRPAGSTPAMPAPRRHARHIEVKNIFAQLSRVRVRAAGRVT